MNAATCMNLYDSRIRAQIRNFLTLFKVKTGIDVPMPAVSYGLSGVTAGVAIGSREIEVNPTFVAQDEKKYMDVIIPHEVAHICASYYYRTLKQRRIQPHGKEWKSIMSMFGLPADTYHDFDTQCIKPKRDMLKHLFTCDCGAKHFLTPKAAVKAQYLKCRMCQSHLTFVIAGKMSVIGDHSIPVKTS